MMHSIHANQPSRNTRNTVQSTATVSDPDSNTGLRLHNPQKILSSVDWLSVSFPILDDSSPICYLESLRDFLTDYFGLEWDCEVRYFAGKFEGIRSLCGAQLKIAVEGSIISSRFVFLTLPGHTLQGFTVDKIAEFLGYCKRLRASITRIDLAVTVENPAFTMESLSEQVKKGNYCTKSQRFSEVVSRLRETQKTGHTLYFGSRESDSFLRVYDKGLESGKAGPNILVRIEAEFKGKFCGQILEKITATPVQALPQTVRAIVLSRLDFRDLENARGKRSNYAERFDWWKAVFDCEAIEWVWQKVEPAIVKVKAWIEDSVSACLSVVYEVMGHGAADDWIKSLLRTGETKWKGRHLALLRQGGL
jgi:hypothetical protein